MKNIKTCLEILRDLKTKLKKHNEDDSGLYSFYEDLECHLNNQLEKQIKRHQLNTGLPPIRKSKDGRVNVVLAVYDKKIYAKDGSNSYIPAWTISNTEYYCNHPDEYLGWIDLEDLQWDKYT